MQANDLQRKFWNLTRKISAYLRSDWNGLSRTVACAALLLAVGLLFGARSAAGAPASPSGILGAGISGIQAHNFDPAQSADMQFDLYGQRGGSPITILHPGVPPGGTVNVYLPADPSLANGAYSVVVTSNRPVASLARTDWPSSGGNLIYEQARAASELILPVLVKDLVGQNALVNVQNASLTTAAQVQIEVMDDTSDSALIDFEVSIAPGASATLDTVNFIPLAALPSGFQGWMRLAANVPIAAVAFLDTATSKLAVSDIAAVPVELAAETLHAPMLFNRWGASERTSGITLLNPGDAAVEASLRYQGLDGACAGMDYVHGPATIAPGGRLVFSQSDLDLPGSGPSGLPSNCAASGVVEADGPVIASVTIDRLRDFSTGTYRAMSLDEAATLVSLPLIRRNHINQLKISTQLHVSNPAPQAASLQLQLFDSRMQAIDCGAACEITLPAGAGARWDIGSLAAMPNGSYGGAMIVSDQPILAVALDGADSAAIDDSVYTGLTPDPENPERSLLPLVLKGADLGFGIPPQPTAAISPTPVSGSPTAVPTQRTVIGSDFDQAGISGYQISNLSDTESFDLEIDHRSIGSAEVSQTILRPNFAPGGYGNVYLPVERLPQGAYGARLRPADPALALLARSDWYFSGGAMIYTPPPAATELLLSGLALGERQSIVALQNSDADTAATLNIDLYADDSQAVPFTSYGMILLPGASDLLRLDLDPDLPGDFSGWARLQSDRPVSALIVTDWLDAPAISSLPGLSPDEISETLLVPAVFGDYSLDPNDSGASRLASRLEILNPNPESVALTVHLRGNDDPSLSSDCRSLDLAMPEESIEAGSRLNLEDLPLPAGCVASARLEASGGPIAASFEVVDLALGLSESFAAYPPDSLPQPVTGADWQLDLPLTRRNHTSLRLGSLVQIVNPGDAPASVTIQLRDASGVPLVCSADCELTVPAGSSRFWRSASVASIPDNSYGSARIDSDQAVEVLVLDVSTPGRIDISGYRAHHRAAAPASGLPLLLHQAELRDLGTAPQTATPLLSLPTKQPVLAADKLVVPLAYQGRGRDVRRIRFSLDLDERWLDFDPSDSEALRADLPPKFEVEINHDPAQASAELTIEVRALAGEDEPLPDWIQFELTLLATAPTPSESAGWLRFADDPAPITWGAKAEPIQPEIRGGWLPRVARLYLPMLMNDF